LLIAATIPVLHFAAGVPVRYHLLAAIATFAGRDLHALFLEFQARPIKGISGSVRLSTKGRIPDRSVMIAVVVAVFGDSGSWKQAKTVVSARGAHRFYLLDYRRRAGLDWRHDFDIGLLHY